MVLRRLPGESTSAAKQGWGPAAHVAKGAAAQPGTDRAFEVGVRARVLIAGDQAPVRRALRILLEGEGFEVVAEAVSSQQAVEAFLSLGPDLVVLDLTGSGRNGLDAAQQIHRISPRTGTILLTMRQDQPAMSAASCCGVRACVLRNSAARGLVRALREVLHGGTYVSPGVPRAVAGAFQRPDGAPKPRLSSRERQVLQLIGEGRKTRDIADQLCISIKTAESHRARIMRKLAIRETAGLVHYAIHEGLSPL